MKNGINLMVVASVCLFQGVVFVQPASAQKTTDNIWRGHAEVEGKWGNKRSLGEVELFVPLWQSREAMLFGDVRGQIDNRHANEFNLGLGYRHIVSPDLIVGAYGFFDRKKSQLGNHYNQGMLGVEAISQNFEGRINGYLPSSKTNEHYVGATGNAHAWFDSNMQFKISSKHGYVRERALPGVDFEVGAGRNFEDYKNWSLWGYGGAYYFHRDGYKTVSGPRGRLEVAYENIPYLNKNSKVTFGVEAQRDSVRKGQVFGVARLRVPFNAERVSPATQAVYDESINDIASRMTTRVVRDVDIVTNKRDFVRERVEDAWYTTFKGYDIWGITYLNANSAAASDAFNDSAENAWIVLDGGLGNIVTDETFFAKNNQIITGGGDNIMVTGSVSGNVLPLHVPGSRGKLAGLSNTNELIRLDDARNVYIADINFENGKNSIVAYSGSDVEVKNITSTNTGGYDIIVLGNSYASVKDSWFDSGATGSGNTIRVNTGGSIDIDNIHVKHSGSIALVATNTNNISIKNSTFNASNSHSIDVNGVRNLEIEGSSFIGQDLWLVAVQNTDSFKVKSSSFDSQQMGFYISSSYFEFDDVDVTVRSGAAFSLHNNNSAFSLMNNSRISTTNSEAFNLTDTNMRGTGNTHNSASNAAPCVIVSNADVSELFFDDINGGGAGGC